MTREEALIELRIIRSVYSNMRKEYVPCCEALSMAIKALEKAEQTEPSTAIENFPQTVIHEDRGTQILDAWQVKQTEPTTEDCSMVDDEDLGVPYVEVNGKDADCPWK